MKKIMLVAALLVAGVNLFAQDLIVNPEGDSLNCRITEIRNGRVYYQLKVDGETRRSFYPISQAKYQKNFFNQEVVTEAELLPRPTSRNVGTSIGLYGGFATLTAPIAENLPPILKSHLKELKKGYHVGADVTTFFSEIVGAGICFNRFKSSAYTDNVYISDKVSGRSRTGTIESKLTLDLLLPYVTLRPVGRRSRLQLSADFGFGYLSYQNKTFFLDRATISGKTLGTMFRANVGFPVDQNLYLSFHLSNVGGTLNKLHYSSAIESYTISLGNQRESVDRIEISMGLRWTLQKTFKK